jgi:hypothetical protein
MKVFSLKVALNMSLMCVAMSLFGLDFSDVDSPSGAEGLKIKVAKEGGLPKGVKESTLRGYIQLKEDKFIGAKTSYLGLTVQLRNPGIAGSVGLAQASGKSYWKLDFRGEDGTFDEKESQRGYVWVIKEAKGTNCHLVFADMGLKEKNVKASMMITVTESQLNSGDINLAASNIQLAKKSYFDSFKGAESVAQKVKGMKFKKSSKALAAKDYLSMLPK